MEDRLSSRRSIPFKRFVVVPTYLWFRGIEQIAISYGRGYMVAFALGIAGLFFSSFLPPDLRPRVEVLTLGLNLFTIFTLIFAAPSTYCYAGTNEKHVGTVTDKLYEWKVETTARVDLVLKNIKIFEERTKRRLAIFRWVLGAAWAVYFSPLIAEAVKTLHASSFSLTQIAGLFPPFAFLLAFFVVIEAYARGVDILFRSIELGCNEQLARIDVRAAEEKLAMGGSAVDAATFKG